MIFFWKNISSYQEENKKYGNTEQEVLKNFRSENWENLSERQKIDALQSIETIQAQKEGRTPCQVIAMDGEENQYGFYNYRDKSIHINLDTSSYQALDTVIHEGRHDYEEHAIETGEGYDEHTMYTMKTELAKNQNGAEYNYASEGNSYDMQGNEMESNNVALEYMMRQSEIFEDDIAFSEYLDERKEHFEYVNDLNETYREDKEQLEWKKMEKAYSNGHISLEEYEKLKENLVYSEPNKMEKKSQKLEQEIGSYQERARDASIEKLQEKSQNQHNAYESMRGTKKEKDLQSLQQENEAILSDIKAQKERCDKAVSEKVQEMQQYVQEKQLSPYTSQSDKQYQDMSEELKKLQNQQKFLKYQEAMLSTDNEMMSGIPEQENRKEVSMSNLSEESKQGNNQNIQMDDLSGENQKNMENQNFQMDDLLEEEQKNTQNQSFQMDDLLEEKQENIQNQSFQMDDLLEEKQRNIQNQSFQIDDLLKENTKKEEIEKDNPLKENQKIIKNQEKEEKTVNMDFLVGDTDKNMDSGKEEEEEQKRGYLYGY